MRFPDAHTFACGQVRCAGLIRMLWTETAFSITKIGEMAGCSYTHAIRIAARMDLGPRPNARPKISLSAATVRREYHRRDKTVHQIAAELSLNVRTLQKRAQKLGLAPRKDGRLQDLVDWPEDFDDLWRMGVRVKEILRACTRPPKSPSQVTIRAKRRGLPRRGPGANANSMTLEQAREIIAAKKREAKAEAAERALAEAMARAAQKERAAWDSVYGRGSHAA